MTAQTPIPKADLEYLEACIQQDHGDYARVDKRALQDAIDEITVRRAIKSAVKRPQSTETKRKYAERDRREAAKKSPSRLCDRRGCRHPRSDHEVGTASGCKVKGCWCIAWREDLSV